MDISVDRFVPEKLLLERRHLGRSFDGLNAAEKELLLNSSLIGNVDGQILTLNTPVYRICSYEKFTRLLLDGMSEFKRPCLWQDPYETLLLTHLWKVDSGVIDPTAVRNGLFSQCWSLVGDSEGQWRSYVAIPGSGIYIRMKSTVRKILASMYATLSEIGFISESIHLCAGTVQYGTKAELEDRSEHVMPNIMRTAGSDVIKSNKAYFEFLRAVYLKRLGFAHEHEVRFTYNLMLSDLKDVLKWPSSYYSKGGQSFLC